MHLLALVVPVKKKGEDALSTTIHFSRFSAPIITDLHNVKAVIGRVETCNRWGIIDHSMAPAKTIFAADESNIIDQHDNDDEPKV